MTSTHADLIQAAAVGDEAAVEQWLAWNGARLLPDAQSLILAAQNGHEAIVRRLLPMSDPKGNDSRALLLAAKKGYESIVRLLLPVSDPKANDAWALAEAAMNGHEAIVRLLLPVSDPKAADSRALALAAENGHEAIVRLLLPVSDPKASSSRALAWAAESSHEAIVAILIESSVVVEVWSRLFHQQSWESLDLLAIYVPDDTVEAALKQAPAEAMPRTRAHRLNETLAKTLEGAASRTLKSRL